MRFPSEQTESSTELCCPSRCFKGSEEGVVGGRRTSEGLVQGDVSVTGARLHRSDGQQIELEGLRGQARRVIRASILTGEIEAGKVYNVAYFTSRLGISPTPVREALLDLSAVGLVEMLRNRGFRVPVRTDEEIMQIMEIRFLLEIPTTVKAASMIGPETLEACRRYASETVKLARSGDVAEFLDYDRALHLEIVGAAGNQRLVDMLGQLRDLTPLYGIPDLAKSGFLVASAEEHVELVEVLESGDVDRVEQLIRSHLENLRGIWAGR